MLYEAFRLVQHIMSAVPTLRVDKKSKKISVFNINNLSG